MKKYKAFFIGLIIVPIIAVLEYIGVFIIPENGQLEVFFVIIFWWLLISLPIHNWKYLRRYKKSFLRISSLLLLFLTALFIDGLMDIPDNPITFVLLMGFWLGSVYVLIPSFIKKYWKLILIIYGPLFLYFLYLRLFSGDVEAYLEIKQDFPFFIFFLPIPVLFLVWVFEQWKWIQNLKAEKSKSELEMLQAQINPHFFFNTLNNLYALTIKHSDKAPEVILKLSEMMRYTIYEGKKDFVPIKDEIEYLSNYIELHKIRYRNKVDIQFNHDIESNIEIAPLLFIIFLENAFKHGLEKNHETGYIHMNLEGNTQQIHFKIENNFELEKEDDTTGIGLTNLKRRLELTYPNKYELKITTENKVYVADLKIKLI
ncbi:histidine kinase [Lutimonas halocynthiae]|uniref:sensor histidine kinase n=1 Tax=Lutimonas halocynthiae TaxID=1446477 RepID=UPI0025B3F06E|nr:histidine kinase [Lutimonas halocynthiae]MDN3644012.1 histidine kinase [Lutimonas halocynthiae]